MFDFDIVDVQITKWKYRRNQREEEGIAYTCLHTHTQDANLINMQTEEEDRHMTQGHAYNKSTVPKICIEFAGTDEREQKKVVMNTKPNTNHAQLGTQVERQVYTHKTCSCVF